MGSPITLSTYLHYQWINDSLLTGTASLTMLTKSQLTTQNNMLLWDEHKIIMGEGHHEVVSQVIVMATQVIMTLV